MLLQLNNHFCQLAGYTPANSAQYVAGFHRHENATQCTVDKDIQLVLKNCFLVSQCPTCTVAEVIPAHVQESLSAFAELPSISAGPSLQPAKVSLMTALPSSFLISPRFALSTILWKV